MRWISLHFFKIIFLHGILPVGLIVFSCRLLAGEPEESHFLRLGMREGLPNNTVYAITQDHRGFIWLGTRDGLSRYDGHDFRNYRYSAKDANSLSNNKIFCLLIDKDNVLWIGTDGGLNRYRRRRDDFIRHSHDPENPRSLSHNTVTALYQDKRGRLWIGTEGGGLNLARPTTGGGLEFEHFQPDPDHPASLGGDSVWAIGEDAAGELWLSTSGSDLERLIETEDGQVVFRRYPRYLEQLNHITWLLTDGGRGLWAGGSRGLFHVIPQAEGKIRVSHYRHHPDREDSLAHNLVWVLARDKEDRLWIGTDGGLSRMEQAGRFNNFHHDPLRPHALGHDRILALFGDRVGTLWVGTDGGGVSLYNPRQTKFTHFSRDPARPDSLSHDRVCCLLKDSRGHVWVGTDQGLNRYDSERRGAKHYFHDPDNPRGLADNRISALLEDHRGRLWIGTRGGVLHEMRGDPGKNPEFIRYLGPHRENNPINALAEDEEGRLWIGRRDGLRRFDPASGRVEHYFHYPRNRHSLSHDVVLSLHIDRENTLWVGTGGGGLNRFFDTGNLKTSYFKRYIHHPFDDNSLSHDEVSAIIGGEGRTLWIGTQGGSLNYFDPIGENFRHYSELDGLNNFIQGLLRDDAGNLWISNDRELTRLNPETRRWRRYDARDGLQDSPFTRAAHRARDGEMFFGGNHGFNAFYPETLRERAGEPPPLVFTEFKLFNRPVKPGPGGPLNQAINEIETLTLAYWQSFFSFEFAALDFIHPEHIEYAYKLEGLDETWRYVGRRRHADYTNVPPGEYIFRVMSSDQEHQWHPPGISLRLRIMPPPWQTSWAYFFYVGMMLALVWGIYRWLSWKTRGRERLLAMRLAHEQRLNQFLDAVPVGVVAFNNRGEMEYSNTAAGKILGKPLSPRVRLDGFSHDYHLYRRGSNKLYAPERLPVAGALQGRQRYIGDMEVLLSDGRRVPLEAWGSPVFDDAGRVGYGILIFQDISLRHQAEHDRLRLLESRQATVKAMRDNKAKSRFLAVASHDLRQPMHTLRLMGESLYYRLERNKDLESLDLLRKMRDTLGEVNGLLNALLDISRLDVGGVQADFQSFDIYFLIEDLWDEFADSAREKGLSFEQRACAARVHSDPLLLKRILRNLLSNALKNTQQGFIGLECRFMENRDRIRLQVRDSGRGIPPEHLPKIFEEFYQVPTEDNQARGLGLGLSIVQRLCWLLELPLHFDSRPGRGTCVTLELQAEAISGFQGKLAATEQAENERTLDRHVLIIEDDPTILQFTAQMVEDWGYEVTALGDLQTLRARLPQARPVDLIIADYHLREADGLEAIKLIREHRGQEIPAIIISADMSLPYQATFKQFTAVLLKPVEPARLHEVVDRVLGQEEPGNAR